MLYDLLMSSRAEVMELKKEFKKAGAGVKPQQRFFNYAEVAEILRISVSAVRTKVKRNALKRICSDNTPLIEKIELERYFKAQNPDFKGL